MRQEIIPAVNVTGPGKNYIVSVLAKDGPRAKSDVFFRIPGMLLGAAVPEEELTHPVGEYSLYTPLCHSSPDFLTRNLLFLPATAGQGAPEGGISYHQSYQSTFSANSPQFS